MTWIAYKRDGEFYAKERGNSISEVRIDYGTWQDVKQTGALDSKIAKKLQEVQSTEIIEEKPSGKTKQRKG